MIFCLSNDCHYIEQIHEKHEVSMSSSHKQDEFILLHDYVRPQRYASDY